MNPNLTDEQFTLLTQLSRKPNITELVTKILQLKLMGKTHAQIAAELGYSTSYINHLHSQAKRQFHQSIK